MGNLTINELSNSLNDYMDEKQNMEDHSLMTENKTIVSAINEIYGKQLIADAIGEPLNESDTFSAMSNDINSLLATFKTNMMNNGIAVEANDRFKQLIDKIATIADNEGKGIQMTSGEINSLSNNTYTTFDGLYSGYVYGSGWDRCNYIELSLNFTPTIILVQSTITTSGSSPFTIYSTTTYDNFSKNGIVSKAEFTCSATANNDGSLLHFSPKIENGKYILPVRAHNTNYPIGTIQCTWLAIGVGEEDTTLRDSLADILENKGAELSGGETLEELIIKVGKLEAKLPPLYLYQEGVINTELIGDLIYSTDSDINYPTYTPGETDFYIGTHQTNSAASANLTAKNAIDTLKYRKICIDCETTCTGEDGPRVKFSFAGSELDITTSQNRQIVSFYFIPSKNAIFRLSAGNSFGWNGQAYTRVYNIWLEDEL